MSGTKKNTEAAAKTVKKPPREEFVLQYGGKEISRDDLLRRFKEIWTKQCKRKVSEMTTVSLYQSRKKIRFTM